LGQDPILSFNNKWHASLILIHDTLCIFKCLLHVVDIFDGELADGAARDRVVRRGEDSVDELSIDDVTRRLDLVEVERVSAGNGAVQSTLQKGCPKEEVWDSDY